MRYAHVLIEILFRLLEYLLDYSSQLHSGTFRRPLAVFIQ